MTFNDEIVDAFRAGQATCDQGGRITNNPYPPTGDDPTAPPEGRGGVLRHWWARGYQSRLPAVDTE